MHLMCSPLESKEKAHADNCGFMACSPTCGHFPTLLLFRDNGKPGGHINSPAGLVPRNAPAVTDQSLARSRLIGTNRLSLSAQLPVLADNPGTISPCDL